MSSRRGVGWVVLVGGGVLLIAGVIWGRSGYYESQAPVLLLLVLGGAALAGVGWLLLRKPKQEVRPVSWRSPADPDRDRPGSSGDPGTR